MADDYKERVKEAVLDEERFRRLTLQHPSKGGETPWRRVVVRPVEIKGVRYLQFSYFDEKRDITKNYGDAEAVEKLDEVLALPYGSLHVERTGGDLRLQITKGGKVIVHKSREESAGKEISLAHDARKELPLPADRPDKYLQSLGIMNPEGKVNPSMQDKFTQINEFLKLLEHTGDLERFEKRPVQILDCGSGSSYLSFAVYHYLNNVKGIESNLVGIDVNDALVEKSNRSGEELGFGGLCFRKSAIIDYKPEVPPDIVLALHACDTATDEALVQGIVNKARLILSVPCCHHHLHDQVKSTAPFGPVIHYGILKKRLADILTDTFRALALRLAGYKTDVVEFVSSEHTDRNLMIRATKRPAANRGRLLREYNELKAFWGVTPHIETLMRAHGRWPEETADEDKLGENETTSNA